MYRGKIICSTGFCSSISFIVLAEENVYIGTSQSRYIPLKIHYKIT